MNILINGILLFLQLLLSSARQGDNITMMVISDTHVMAPELLKEDGTAFAKYISNDRKMLRESPLLMEEATKAILKERPQVLLIVGDLTKDGETVSHLYLRDRYLSRIKAAGTRIFVIPGNHDVDNPHAVEFHGDSVRRVPTPKAAEFAQIYNDYGYGEAISRDANSLSYVVQLAPNTRLLCLDACEYELNDYGEDVCVTAGRLKDETVEWIKQQGKEAEEKGMRLLAMMHHGVVEHWTWQEKAMGEYLVDEWRKRADMLSKLGIEIVFTGHFHAQDVARRGSLYDIETGSLVSYPSPYRIVNIKDNVLSARSYHLTGDSIGLPEGMTLGDYSKQFACDGLSGIVNSLLPEEASDELRDDVCGEICDAYTAHLAGDEHKPAEREEAISEVGSRVKEYSWKLSYIFKHIAKYLWTDVEPEDNDIDIRLEK